MTPTLDEVPGSWTLWLRTNVHPETVAYQAVFTAMPPGTSEGQVTVTLGSTTYTGTWQEKDGLTDERVTFQVGGIPGIDDGNSFRGYLVGQAMGGSVGRFLGPVPISKPEAAWSAYKVSD